MHVVVLLLFSLAGVGGQAEYSRTFDERSFDQSSFEAETYGLKKALARQAEGLRMAVQPGAEETGWKTPPQLKIGGDFTIVANLIVNKLPKPAQDDGAAVGIAIATGDINQPELTLVRLREPSGAEVYRAIEKAGGQPGQPMGPGGPMMMMPGQGMPKGAKPPRHVFPAAGTNVRLELSREKTVVRFQVVDSTMSRPRYLGQTTIGPGDISAVKLFVSNRNGAETLEAVWHDVTIRAERLSGLGTTVRTVFDKVVYADPTAIDKGILVIGGPPKTPPAPPNAAKPGDAKKPGPEQPADSAAKPKEGAPPAKEPAPAAVPPAPTAPAPPQATAATAPAPTPAPGTTVPASPAASAPGNANAPAQDKPKDAKPPEPKAKIPLDEVETIHFERTPALAARFLGQRNVDLTGPAPDAKKDEPDEAKKPKDEAKTKDEAKPKDAAAAKDEAKPKYEAKPKDEPKSKDEAKDEAKPRDEARPKDEAKPKDEPKPKDEDKPKEESKAKDEPKSKDEPKDEAKPKDESKPKEDSKKDENAPKEKPKPQGEAKKPKDATKAETASEEAIAPPPGTVSKKVPRVEPEKNGVRDVCLALSGLRSAKIKQVTVTCQTDKGPAGWRLDTTDSHDWPLVVKRAGTEPWAELYLEPPAGDSFEKDYQINITYEDGQNGTATVKPAEHTDAKKSFAADEPEATLLGATVYLTGEEKLYGVLESISEESLRLGAPWPDQKPLEIPLARVVGVQLSIAERKESPESFVKRLKTRSAEDLLLAHTKDGEVLAIPGLVEGTEHDRLKFHYQEQTRTLPLGQVEGWVMAARPDPKPALDLSARLSLVSGLVLSGRWKDLDTQTWTLESPWGQALKIPAAEVQDVRFRGGAMTYLSDFEPSEVEETPFFGHKMPWKRDVSLLGEPLRMSGQTYERGIAVHSRSRLTYDLNGRYARFAAVLGFDDSTHGKGRVDCRILGDGKVLYSKNDLRASEPPAQVSLSVARVTQLRLEIDFGPDQDTGDRIIWASARLYRIAAEKAAAKAPAIEAPKREAAAERGANND